MRNFLQVGYVTDDIDAAASYLESTFGTIECVKHFRSSLGRASPGAAAGSFVVVDGVTAEEWLIDVALVNAGATNLEIIRPLGGAVDLYRGAIRPGVPSTVHHLGFRRRRRTVVENGRSDRSARGGPASQAEGCHALVPG
jgi:hypothetical protein